MLGNLRYSMQGMQDGVAWQEGRARQKADDLRRAEMDALAQQDRARQMAEHQQDRDISLSDREEFGLPEKRARADAIKQQERDRALRVEAGQAYAALLRGDPKPTADFYTNRVPDGHAANIQILPDGRIQIQHPNGSVIAKDADEVWLGKEDGTGMGLYQLAFPDQLAETVQAGRKERASRKVSLEDEDRKNTQHMREIWAQRQPMPTVGMDSEGNMGQINGTSFRPITGPDGKPVRGSIGGRGGFGRDTRTAFQKNLEYRTELAIARDRSGALADMDPREVAGMIEAMDQSGKSRSERMKVALSMMNAAYSEFEDTAAISARATALVDAVGQIAGPQPTMPYSMDSNVRGEPAPGASMNDPLGIR